MRQEFDLMKSESGYLLRIVGPRQIGVEYIQGRRLADIVRTMRRENLDFYIDGRESDTIATPGLRERIGDIWYSGVTCNALSAFFKMLPKTKEKENSDPDSGWESLPIVDNGWEQIDYDMAA